jgi:hypothetical protein
MPKGRYTVIMAFASIKRMHIYTQVVPLPGG